MSSFSLERVLELLKEGKTPDEISLELDVSKDEVDGAIKILESMGYVEKVELGSSACEGCPLRRVCPGSCTRVGDKILVGFTLSEKGKGVH